MKVNMYSDNTVYFVDWKHDSIAFDSKFPYIRGSTICNISRPIDIRRMPLMPIFDGIAYCSYSDQFCKETGRKVSLTKALKNGKFTKDEREQFWNAYFNRYQPEHASGNIVLKKA